MPLRSTLEKLPCEHNVNGHQLFLNKATYANGQVALQLYNEYGEHHASPTFHLHPNNTLEVDHVAIRNYDDYKLYLKYLVDCKVVEAPTRYIGSQKQIAICKLLV